MVTTKKFVKKTKKIIKKNYGGKRGIGNLLKDVTMLKSLINVEKKVWVHSGGALSAQQSGSGINGVGQSLLSFRIPQGNQGGPNPIVTNSNGERNGNSIKLTGMVMNIKISQQASTVSELRYKIYIVRRKECSQPMTASQVLSSMFEPNPFTSTLPAGSIIDYHSQRFQNTYSQFSIIKTLNGKLTADSLASQTAYQHHIVPLKLDFHLRYQGTSTLDPLDNNLYMFIMCDTGRTDLLTGVIWEYSLKSYFIDN